MKKENLLNFVYGLIAVATLAFGAHKLITTKRFEDLSSSKKLAVFKEESSVKDTLANAALLISKREFDSAENKLVSAEKILVKNEDYFVDSKRNFEDIEILRKIIKEYLTYVKFTEAPLSAEVSDVAFGKVDVKRVYARVGIVYGKDIYAMLERLLIYSARIHDPKIKKAVYTLFLEEKKEIINTFDYWLKALNEQDLAKKHGSSVWEFVQLIKDLKTMFQKLS